MAKTFYWQCCICGKKYLIKGRHERLLYGCRSCHKGLWIKNNKELMKIEKKEIKRK